MEKWLLDREWDYLESTLGHSMLIQMSRDWKPVNLPHDVALEKERKESNPSGFEEGFTSGSSLYYKKEFVIDKEWENKTLILEFEGIMGLATIYLNSHVIAKHVNGYTSFLVDIGEHIIFDEKNILLVHVENSHKPSSRWYAGTGIYRHVWLHVGDKLHIKPWNNQVSSSIENETAHLEVKTTLSNNHPSQKKTFLHFEVISMEDEVVSSETKEVDIEGNSERQIVTGISLNSFNYWDIDNPYLYELKTSIVKDGAKTVIHSTKTGIRDISLDAKKGFRLNGNSIKLKGGCIHHDHGPLGSASYDRAEERKIELLKSSGFNAVRLAHNPHAPALLEACDRLGMLVINEAFDAWVAGRKSFDYHLFFEKYWEEDLEAFVNRDFNHPSIIMWSIGNEVEERNGSSNGYVWSKRLADKVRELDSNRLVTASACSLMSEYADMTTIVDGNVILNMLGNNVDPDNDIWGEVTENYFKPLDAAGYNYKVKRYKYDSKRFPHRVIYGSETYPHNVFENWQETLKHSNVIGDFVWTAIDYLGEAGLGRVNIGYSSMTAGGEFPWFYANCGDIDVCGMKRPQSYYRDIIWGNRDRPYIAVLPPKLYGESIHFKPWGWEPVERSYTFPGYEGKTTSILVYSEAEEVELFVNGLSQGKKKVGLENEYKTTFDIIYEPGVIEVVASSRGKTVTSDKLTTTGNISAIQLLPDRTTIHSNYGDLSYILVSATDENGEEVTNARSVVQVEVEGNGELVAFGSSDPLSTEMFNQNERKLFQGKALIIVKSLGVEGSFTVKAKTSGVEETKVTVLCQEVQTTYQEFYSGEQESIYSFDMTMGELIANESTNAIFEKYLPEFMNGSLINRTKDISFKQIVQFAPSAMLPKQILKHIENELRRLK